MRKLMASTGMPTSRFLRLVAMCCGYTAVALPLSIYYFIAAVDNGGPWTAYNWTFIHSGNDHQVRVAFQSEESLTNNSVVLGSDADAPCSA